MVLDFTFNAFILSELFFVYDRRVQFHSFAYGYLVFPTSFIEETLFSPLCIFDAIVKG